MESPAPKAANQNEKQSLDTWGFPAMVGEIILTMLDLRVLMVSGCGYTLESIGRGSSHNIEVGPHAHDSKDNSLHHCQGKF